MAHMQLPQHADLIAQVLKVPLAVYGACLALGLALALVMHAVAAGSAPAEEATQAVSCMDIPAVGKDGRVVSVAEMAVGGSGGSATMQGETVEVETIRTQYVVNAAGCYSVSLFSISTSINIHLRSSAEYGQILIGYAISEVFLVSARIDSFLLSVPERLKKHTTGQDRRHDRRHLVQDQAAPGRLRAAQQKPGRLHPCPNPRLYCASKTDVSFVFFVSTSATGPPVKDDAVPLPPSRAWKG
jgi:hypothetical protein